jgi:acyl-coenzyme A thioesterase PaaI-like protein
VHGGVYTTAIESAASIGASTLNQGRTQQLWQVNLTDEAGRLIAHGEVRLQNVSGQ